MLLQPNACCIVHEHVDFDIWSDKESLKVVRVFFFKLEMIAFSEMD